MAAAAILNFTKTLILAIQQPLYSQYLISIDTATILNFHKSNFWAPITLLWRISICKPNLVQIGPEIAEIHLFMYFRDGGRPPSWI